MRGIVIALSDKVLDIRMTFSLIFNKEPLLLVTDRDLNPGLPHAEYRLLYLAEIRLIRETEKPTNAQKVRMVDSLLIPLFPL